jgi:DNA modification methylase
MAAVASNAVDLVVTSPPYPMIAMWDALFCAQDAFVAEALKNEDGPAAFERMHIYLDAVWRDVFRVTKPGGFVCINIGDATRTLAGDFALYANHARILGYLLALGFRALPLILWRKQTNAPNKFMGAGMLPAGAYVTLEHEYILILRKGSKRTFSSMAEKRNRRRSALFWEERNIWFSDVWMDLKGARQTMANPALRKRSAAFPFEIPYRLINMFSVKKDTVLDPFAGIGTSAAAALAAGRSSIGYELDAGFMPAIAAGMNGARSLANRRIRGRIDRHLDFVEARYLQKGPFKHKNIPYGFPVVTGQERDLLFNEVLSVDRSYENRFHAQYRENPLAELRRDWQAFFQGSADSRREQRQSSRSTGAVQATLPGFALNSQR